MQVTIEDYSVTLSKIDCLFAQMKCFKSLKIILSPNMQWSCVWRTTFSSNAKQIKLGLYIYAIEQKHILMYTVQDTTKDNQINLYQLVAGFL